MTKLVELAITKQQVRVQTNRIFGQKYADHTETLCQVRDVRARRNMKICEKPFWHRKRK